jgi:hypothetical protein
VTQIKSHFPFSPSTPFTLTFFLSSRRGHAVIGSRRAWIGQFVKLLQQQSSKQAINPSINPSSKQASKKASKQASNFVQNFFSLGDFNYGLFAIQRLKICLTRFASSSSSSSSCPILLVINIPSCTS